MKVLLIAALVAVAAARPQEYHDDVFHFSSKVNHENLARPSIVSSVPVVKSVPQYQQYSQYSQYPQYNQYAQYPQYQQYKQYNQFAQYPQYQQYNQYVQSVPTYSHVHAHHHVVEQPSVLLRSVEQEVPAVTAVHTTHVHHPAVYSQVAAVHKEVAPVVPRASFAPQYHSHGVETHTKILKQVQEFDPAGIYRADYATENGITAAEQGTVKDTNAKEGPVAAKEGSYSYTGPDGVLYSVNWVADEFGFRASGAHLPGAEEIKKSVDLIASQPQKYDAEGNLVYKQF